MFTPTDLSHLALFKLPLPPCLTVWEHGKVVLTGHRIGLHIIVQDLKAGYTPTEIRKRYDLDMQQLDEVLAFIHAHLAEVEEYYREYEAAGERHYQEWLKSDMGKSRLTWEELIRRWKAKFGDQLPDFLQRHAADGVNGEPGTGKTP